MKKSLIVLLIAVLALSSVFAAITGSTTASYKVDFTDMSASYTAPGTGNLDADVTLDLQSQPKLGEGNAYVDFEAEATLDVIYSEDSLHAAGAKSGTGVADPAIKIKKADIVAGNWKINLLKATTAFDYAQSAIDSVTANKDTLEEAKVYYTFKNTVGLTSKGAKIVDKASYLVAVNNAALNAALEKVKDDTTKATYTALFTNLTEDILTVNADQLDAIDDLGVDYYVLADLSGTTKKLGNGLTVSYDGFSFGLSFERENDKDAEKKYSQKSQLLVGFETKEFALDEFKFQAAIALSSAKTSDKNAVLAETTFGPADTQFAVSAKAGYSDIFTAAFDMKVASNAISGFDVSAKVAYDPLTVDFYYASKANVYDNVTGDALEAGKFVTVGEALDGTPADIKAANAAGIGTDETNYYVFADANTKFNLMSVKGALDFASFDVPVKLTVTAKDILGANTLDVEASTTAVDGLEIGLYLKDALATRRLGGKLAFTGFEGLTLSAEGNYQLADAFEVYDPKYTGKYTLKTSADNGDSTAACAIYEAYELNGTTELYAKDVFAGTFWADFKAEYAAEKFTAKAEAEFRTVTSDLFDVSEYATADDTALDFGFKASIESDKLVDGATLKLEYKYVPASKTLASYASTLRSLDEAGNAITASCKVVF